MAFNLRDTLFLCESVTPLLGHSFEICAIRVCLCFMADRGSEEMEGREMEERTFLCCLHPPREEERAGIVLSLVDFPVSLPLLKRQE